MQVPITGTTIKVMIPITAITETMAITKTMAATIIAAMEAEAGKVASEYREDLPT
jgi:hypothetical protein